MCPEAGAIVLRCTQLRVCQERYAAPASAPKLGAGRRAEPTPEGGTEALGLSWPWASATASTESPAAHRGRLSSSRAWRHQAPKLMPVSGRNSCASVRGCMCSCAAQSASVAGSEGSLTSLRRSRASRAWRGMGTCSASGGAASIPSRMRCGIRSSRPTVGESSRSATARTMSARSSGMTAMTWHCGHRPVRVPGSTNTVRMATGLGPMRV